MSFLLDAQLPHPGLMESIIVGGVFAAAAVLFGVLGIRARHHYKRWIRVPGKVVKTGWFHAYIEWNYRGQTYAYAPLGYYALRGGGQHEVLLDPQFTTSARLDVWTHNGIAWLIGSGLCWVFTLITLAYLIWGI